MSSVPKKNWLPIEIDHKTYREAATQFADLGALL